MKSMMPKKNIADVRKCVTFKDFDLCVILMWHKAKKIFAVKTVWCTDNFTCRDHPLNLKLVNAWRQQVLTFKFANDSKFVRLQAAPYVSFDLEEEEVPLFLNFVETF